ncbi:MULTISPECIES: hypothetical protein [Pyrobaculum]|nr:hypothetical protein [Pyrobaculum arsenaticum]MCY0890934.1 hypothetical protein [Pyrobaculum arsenaticum]
MKRRSVEKEYLEGEIALEEYIKMYYLKRRNPLLYLLKRLRP